jgi:hypothetical protein
MVHDRFDANLSEIFPTSGDESVKLNGYTDQTSPIHTGQQKSEKK